MSLYTTEVLTAGQGISSNYFGEWVLVLQLCIFSLSVELGVLERHQQGLLWFLGIPTQLAARLTQGCCSDGHGQERKTRSKLSPATIRERTRMSETVSMLVKYKTQ